MLIFVGYRTIITGYVAKWGSAQMCGGCAYAKLSTKGGIPKGGIPPLLGSTDLPEKVSRDMGNCGDGISNISRYGAYVCETPGQLQGSKTLSPQIHKKNSKITPRPPTPNSSKKISKNAHNSHKMVLSIFRVFQVFLEFFQESWGLGRGGIFLFFEEFWGSEFGVLDSCSCPGVSQH